MVHLDVLDYSSGWPSPAAVKANDYGGTVRYIGTQGRSKNLTLDEATAYKAAGVPIALVHERTAGWMAGGALAGASAARDSLADAAACKIGVRALYLACDVDVTSAAEMRAVTDCLDGAARVVGLGRLGVYGEADVIDAALGGRHATWGWQTRAWSGGRVSRYAHIFQQVGYVYVDGVQCDRSTVLAVDGDWGGWTVGGVVADLTDQNLTDIANRVVRVLRDDRNGALLAIRQEVITALADPTHHYLQDEFNASNDAVAAKLDEVQVALANHVDTLAGSIAREVVASLPPAVTGVVDYDEVQRRAVIAVRTALLDGVGT